MELDYMQKLRWWLKTFDGWPSAVLEEKVRLRFIHHKFLFLFWLTIFIGQLEFIRRHIGRIPFFELGHSCVSAACNVVTITYKAVNRYCRIATKILVLQAILAPILYNVPSFIENISSGMLTLNGNVPINGTFKYSLDYVMPFDLQTGLFRYIILATANFILSFWVGITFLIYDLYMTVVVCHICGHLEMLDQELRNFIRPSAQHYAWYAPEEIKEVRRKLKMLINHHNMILKFADHFSNAFSLTLAVYFAFYQFCCCFLLLLCSTMETAALVKFGPMTVICYQQLIQLSAIFEILCSKSEKLTSSVYSLPWECMGVQERRLLLSFLHKVQEQPINVKALGILPVGVQTMAAILKGSVSYFVMLRTLGK